MSIKPEPINDDNREAVLMRMLKGSNKTVANYYGVNAAKRLRIKGKKGYGMSIAVHDGEGDFCTYCSGSGKSTLARVLQDLILRERGETYEIVSISLSLRGSYQWRWLPQNSEACS